MEQSRNVIADDYVQGYHYSMSCVRQRGRDVIFTVHFILLIYKICVLHIQAYWSNGIYQSKAYLWTEKNICIKLIIYIMIMFINKVNKVIIILYITYHYIIYILHIWLENLDAQEIPKEQPWSFWDVMVEEGLWTPWTGRGD